MALKRFPESIPQRLRQACDYYVEAVHKKHGLDSLPSKVRPRSGVPRLGVVRADRQIQRGGAAAARPEDL